MTNPLFDKMIEAIREGVAFVEEERFDDAAKKFDDIIQTGVIVSQSLVQRGRCHWEMKRWDKALPDFELALKMEPENYDIQWTVSLMYLQAGKFAEGWDKIDARWKSARFDSARLKTSKPSWEPNKGYKDLLVWSEQGVGDQILYGSMFRALRKQVNDMLVMIDARLIPLFQRANPDINFCPQNARVKGIDSQIPVGSIGRYFINDISDISKVVSEKFLKADPERVKALRKELDIKDTDFVVGLSWSSAAPKIGDHKSVDLREFDRLFKIPNVRVINLQYTNSFKQIYDYEVATGNRIESVPSIDNRDDLDGLAAIMECCDAVVSVSNATAHLAGGLGVRTLLLDGNKLWFWSHTDNGKSLWYPSVQSYPRDNVHASWTPQVTIILDSLEDFAFRKEKGCNVDTKDSEVKPTFVFFHVGDDSKLTDRLAKSIRKTMPDADIIMCTDSDTPIPDDVDSIHVGKYDRSKLMTERLRAFSELRLSTPAIYVDSDMEMIAPFNPMDVLGSKDVMMCRRSFGLDAMFNPYQRGLDFSEYRNKTIDEVYPYLACATITRDWKVWANMYDTLRLFIADKFHIWYGDQEALKVYASSNPNNKIGFTNEMEFACLPEHFDSIVSADIDVKFIHYKGDRK
jgi:hypothetical protein